MTSNPGPEIVLAWRRLAVSIVQSGWSPSQRIPQSLNLLFSSPPIPNDIQIVCENTVSIIATRNAEKWEWAGVRISYKFHPNVSSCQPYNSQPTNQPVNQQFINVIIFSLNVYLKTKFSIIFSLLYSTYH